MSGVEILGTGAAALQVAQTTISIASMVWELYHQDPPKSIRNHLSQVSSLAATATIIEQEPRLHIKPVQDLVHSTLERTYALRESLQHTQHQYGEGAWLRYKSIYINRLQEKELLRDLDSLEKEKTCLVLCISTIQTGYLGNIIDLIQRQPISCPNTQMPTANSKVSMAPKKSTAKGTNPLDPAKTKNFAEADASKTPQEKPTTEKPTTEKPTTENTNTSSSATGENSAGAKKFSFSHNENSGSSVQIVGDHGSGAITSPPDDRSNNKNGVRSLQWIGNSDGKNIYHFTNAYQASLKSAEEK